MPTAVLASALVEARETSHLERANLTPGRAHGIWARPLLIGTAETIAMLAGQLAVAQALPAGVTAALADAEENTLTEVLTGGNIAGIPLIGTIDTLMLAHRATPFSVAVVSLPQKDQALIRRVRATLRQLGIIERFVPPVTELLEKPVLGEEKPDVANPHHAVNRTRTGSEPGRLSASRAGEVDMVELIGRTPYGIDRKAVARVIEAKRVLVTGAGGSIGSEICRIAATFKPSLLIMMERSENALFEIDRQIARRFPDVPRKAVLHDVVDADATLRQCVHLKPHAVFHSAAHKHVPLMEDHPGHAVANNLFGTKSIADAAMAVGAERFVMISSDKAVNPSSVMGATKRLAEMYVQGLNARAVNGGGGPVSRTSFSMVRFGNVLGSACSVLPIWGNQLAEGGPLTVTDARMTRYFMTINEAAALVIQSSAIEARDALTPTIYVLDMGDPIKILDLAQRFATLNGFDPRVILAPNGKPAPAQSEGSTIDIVLTGTRPGEKLHEELAYGSEALTPTEFPGIMALADSTPRDVDLPAMIADFSSLRGTAAAGAGGAAEKNAVLAAIRRHVPEMVESQATSTGSSSQPTSSERVA